MFQWLKENQKPVAPRLQDFLFGDVPFVHWVNSFSAHTTTEPAATFVRAQVFLDSNDTSRAIDALLEILAMPDLESRHYMQAGFFLNNLNADYPARHSKEVFAVVVEVAVNGGTDTVAAYVDHCARYYNYSGAGVIWEHPNTSLDAAIDSLLRVAAPITQAAPAPRKPDPPKKDCARISVITIGGIHSGEGPMEIFQRDRLGGPVLTAALHLMQQLMQVGKAPHPATIAS